MTQPDQYYPPTSINADPGFAVYAARTEEDWDTIMRNGIMGALNPLEWIVNMLLGWIEQIPIIGPLLADLIELVNSIIATLTGIVGGTISQLAQWVLSIPIIGDLVFAITGVLEGLPFLGQFFTDFFSFFGITGLGSGAPILGALADIPILGPVVSAIVEAITGIVGSDMNIISAYQQDWRDMFGNPEGLGTGDVIIPDIADIPLLGDLSLISDAATVNELVGAQWFIDLQTLMGDPTGLGGGTPSVSGDVPLVGPLNDTIYQAMTGITATGHVLDDVLAALGSIPGLNVLGTGGPATVSDTLQTTWDQLVGGFVGAPGSDTSLADVYNIAQTVGGNAALGLLGWDVLGIRDNTSMSNGLLSTSQTSIPVPAVSSGSAPTVTTSNSASLIGFQRIDKSMPVGAVRWYGNGTTNVTAFGLGVWKMSPNGDAELVYDSGDIVGDIDGGGSPVINYHELADPIAVEAGDVIGVELTPYGSGTHNVVGHTSWLPDDPHALPKRYGATRNAATPAPSSYFKDPYDFSSQDDTNWTGTWSSGGGHVSLSSGYLSISPLQGGYEYIQSAASGNFTDGVQILIESVQRLNTSDGNTYCGISLFTSDWNQDRAALYWHNGNLTYQDIDGGSQVAAANTAFNATDHRWWRIRRSGSDLKFEVSPNGWDWTVLWTRTVTGITFSDVKVRIWGSAGAGSTSPGEARFDNFNIVNVANLTYTDRLPLIELAISLDGAGANYHAPQLYQFTSSGTQAIPSWCNTIRAVPLGGGGGGYTPTSYSEAYGHGGYAGDFGSGTWVRGVDFDDTVTSVSYTVGNGGGTASAGSNSSASVPGHTVTGLGGAAGSSASSNESDKVGEGAGNLTYQGVTYSGGAEQNTTAVGNTPGGGGYGGNYGYPSPMDTGYAGAKGCVWLRFEQ